MITRRNLIKASASTVLLVPGVRILASEAGMTQRIGDIIREYDAQGIHRTGTDVDNLSANWLADRVRTLGVTPELDSLAFRRVSVLEARLTLGDEHIPGVPFYDAGFTGAEGIRGSLGDIGSNADIGVAVTLPYAAGPTYAPIEAARRAGKHKAILLVNDPRLPPDGIATINAEAFEAPYGPPVLQVANKHIKAIQAAAANREQANFLAHAEYIDATASNVQARIAGSEPGLAPLVVMTPRSGWWHCASERGGGIAAWLEIMRAVKQSAPTRDVIFTANTGHELGHTGLDHYLEANRALVKEAAMWIHLGANFAARVMPGVRMQFSDEKAEQLAKSALGNQAIAPSVTTPTGTRPYGEARNIYDGGGRYISILGGNGLFHHPDDRWPGAVDLDVTTRWIAALVDICVQLATERGNGE